VIFRTIRFKASGDGVVMDSAADQLQRDSPLHRGGLFGKPDALLSRLHLPGGHISTPAPLSWALMVSRRTRVASWIFRRDHPSRPKAMICCFFSSFKTFAMLREATYPPAAVNVLDDCQQRGLHGQTPHELASGSSNPGFKHGPMSLVLIRALRYYFEVGKTMNEILSLLLLSITTPFYSRDIAIQPSHSWCR
jgi:hypothetical protein